MTPQHHLPADIERTSLSIITAELAELGLTPLPETAAVVKRVIHTTADFDYARNLRFTPDAVAAGVKALRAGTPIITDTNMALAGITKPGLARLGGTALCYMADPEVAALAKASGTTRAVASMQRAAQEHPGAVLAVGNAPTALLTIADQIEAGLRPALVIGVPVGFVNVVESKERLFATCEAFGVPAIVAMGRKGGSNVAAAICNALLYSAAEMLDPAARGWRGPVFDRNTQKGQNCRHAVLSFFLYSFKGSPGKSRLTVSHFFLGGVTRYFRTARSSTAMSTGLDRCSSIPASLLFSMSSVKAFAVMARIEEYNEKTVTFRIVESHRFLLCRAVVVHCTD